jgi:sugar lactone lactonase YvrE
VADTGNHRIVLYDADLKLLGTAGKKGSGSQEVDSPVGMAAAPGGEIYVADVINRRVQVMDPKGAFVRPIAIPGWAEWCEPYLAADSDGTLYVADPTRSTVLVMNPQGGLVRTIGASEAGESFRRPSGIAIDRERRVLFVVDLARDTVGTVPLPPAPSAPSKPKRTRRAAPAAARVAPQPLGLSFARPREGPRDVKSNTPPPPPADSPARGAR